MDRERRDYTPTKLSKLTNITNNNLSSIRQGSDLKAAIEYNRPQYGKANADYNQRSVGQTQMSILKDYELLKMQVRQMESQNRQLSNDIETLRYQKNVHETKYHQKVSSEEDAISQFQKEKNYQVGLIKLKNEEEVNRLRREYDYKLDELQRQLRNRDYHNRQTNQKNSYFQLKINELSKGIDILSVEHAKLKQANVLVKEHLNHQQFNKNKLLSITEELQRQKSQMQAQIHVLLDIQAEKSRNINTVEIQCRNSDATERSLHEKLTMLTDNFASLEEHISIMKERLISTDIRNEQLEKQLQGAEYKLADKDQRVIMQKDLESQIRRELEIYQQREFRRDRQFEELILENQRLVNEVNTNRQKLHDLCISQGIEV